MTMTRFYQVWVILVLAAFAAVNLVGWTLAEVTEVHQVPKTVRDNPGTYRTHYYTHVHTRGGK